MVEIFGHAMFLALQHLSREGWILSFPRFGCSQRRRLISAMISSCQFRFRFVFGVRFFSLSASGFFSPSLNRRFQVYNVLRETLKASEAIVMLCFSANAKILARSSAF